MSATMKNILGKYAEIILKGQALPTKKSCKLIANGDN